jgi:small subunit ribosomal protein S2
MKRLPGAIFIIDTKKENIALKEAKKMGIPVFAMVDTNSDPTLVDFPIPANDDAAKSISLIVSKVADAIVEARLKIKEEKAIREAAEEKKSGEEKIETDPDKKKSRKVKKESE